MGLRNLWSVGESSRISLVDIDGLKISFSHIESPIGPWAEIESPRDPGVDGKVSKVPREGSDILQASLLGGKVSDVSGVWGLGRGILQSLH